MLQQRQRSRADWLVRGSSLVLVNAVYVVYSVEQSKRHTTHHTTEDFDDFWVVGGGWGLAWCGQRSASYRADGRVAISTSDRPAYYFKQNEYTKDLECSEGVLSSDAIRMGNATRHSPRNIAYSQLSLS